MLICSSYSVLVSSRKATVPKLALNFTIIAGKYYCDKCVLWLGELWRIKCCRNPLITTWHESNIANKENYEDQWRIIDKFILISLIYQKNLEWEIFKYLFYLCCLFGFVYVFLEFTFEEVTKIWGIWPFSTEWITIVLMTIIAIFIKRRRLGYFSDRSSAYCQICLCGWCHCCSPSVGSQVWSGRDSSSSCCSEA